MNKYDVAEWEHNDVTVYYKNLIREIVDFTIKNLSSGNILHDSDIDRKYSYTIGYLDGLRVALEAELITEEVEDEDLRDPKDKGS